MKKQNTILNEGLEQLNGFHLNSQSVGVSVV